jgi:hypothetical protein
MKPTDDIHKLIKKLQIKASAELDRKVHNDISQTLVKLQKIESAHAEPIIWRFITKGGVMKLAVAAAIIIAFGIGFSIGQRSNPTRLATYSLDVGSYTSAVSAYPTAPKAEDSFWRQKVLAAMQSRPYVQSQFDKTSLIDAYKQYRKEKHYD